MDILLARLIEGVITPPGIFLIFILAGLITSKKYHHRLSRNIFLIGSLLFVISSLPITAKLLYRYIESVPALTSSDIANNQAGAIVVLGAGRYKNAPEFNQDRTSGNNLERLRYAVYLHTKTGVPILASGGNPLSKGESEARLMERELNELFKIRKVWLEGKSNNTWENGQYSLEILKQKNIKTIFLVTQAWHMPRAVQSFTNSDIKIIPAPTGFRGHETTDLSILDFIPSANAMKGVQFVLHEIIGGIWYRLRY